MRTPKAVLDERIEGGIGHIAEIISRLQAMAGSLECILHNDSFGNFEEAVRVFEEETALLGKRAVRVAALKSAQNIISSHCTPHE